MVIEPQLMKQEDEKSRTCWLMLKLKGERAGGVELVVGRWWKQGTKNKCVSQKLGGDLSGRIYRLRNKAKFMAGLLAAEEGRFGGSGRERGFRLFGGWLGRPENKASRK